MNSFELDEIRVRLDKIIYLLGVIAAEDDLDTSEEEQEERPEEETEEEPKKKGLSARKIE